MKFSLYTENLLNQIHEKNNIYMKFSLYTENLLNQIHEKNNYSTGKKIILPEI